MRVHRGLRREGDKAKRRGPRTGRAHEITIGQLESWLDRGGVSAEQCQKVQACGAASREKENVAPLPGFDSAQIFPPKSFDDSLAGGKPDPLPGTPAPCRRLNGSKIFVACSCGNPSPLSLTEIRQCPSPCTALISICGGSLPWYLIAFPIRFLEDHDHLCPVRAYCWKWSGGDRALSVFYMVLQVCERNVERLLKVYTSTLLRSILSC